MQPAAQWVVPIPWQADNRTFYNQRQFVWMLATWAQICIRSHSPGCVHRMTTANRHKCRRELTLGQGEPKRVALGQIREFVMVCIRPYRQEAAGWLRVSECQIVGQTNLWQTSRWLMNIFSSAVRSKSKVPLHRFLHQRTFPSRLIAHAVWIASVSFPVSFN